MSVKVSVVQHGTPSRSAKGLGPWLARIAPRSARGEVTIAILPASQVRELNRLYRKVNKTADVLSFPSEERAPLTPRRLPLAPFLGDIVISRETAHKQAEIQGHSVAVEFRVLALHGLLHLLGYDHEVDAGRMARAEAHLRRRAGLPLGLIARS